MPTIPTYPPAVTPLSGEEQLAVWQGAGQKSATVDDVAQYALGDLTQRAEEQVALAAEQVALATAQVGLAENQVALAAGQVALATAKAETATTQATSANASAASALAYKNQAASAAALSPGLLPGPASALPYAVKEITGGIGTGSAGVPGWYIGGVSGGPLGFAWSYQIGSDGKLAGYQIDNPGLATTNAVPTLSLPSGAISGATIPVAQVAVISSGRLFYAPSTDGKSLLAWVNNGGSLASAPVGGTQVAIPLTGYYNIRIVATYGEQASIPMGERSAGMMVKVVQAVDLGSGNYRALWFTLNPSDLTNTGWVVAPEFTQNWVAFTSPPIYDQGVLYIPGFYVLGYENNGYGTYYAPTSPATYVASPGSTSNSICRHVFDKAIYAAGGSVEDAIIEVSDTAYPLRDTQTQVVLAVTRNGRLIDSRDYTMAGDLPGGAVPNQFRYGRQPDNAPFIFPGAMPADITDTDLIAAGFTRGIKGAPNSPVTIGDYLAEPFKVGDYIAVRFRLYAEADGVFGNPSIYIYTTESDVNTPPIVPAIFRQINSKVREYYYAGKLTVSGNGKWAVGSNNTANASRVWVVGAQFWRGTQPGYWINSSDYPDPIDCAPLMADELWAVSDRALPLFPANGMADRALAITSEVSTAVVIDPDSGNTPKDAVPQAAQCYFDTARDDGVIWLDPAKLAGQSLSLIMRADKAAHSILNRVLPVHVRTVPLGSPINIKIGVFGDSHSASYFVRYLKTYLNAWNINVTFYGTLDNTLGDKPGETREYGEARGGWGIANFFGTYQLIGGAGSDNVWDQVLGPGSITAYTGGVYDIRQRTNPFLSNDGASGSSAPVISGALPLLGGGTASGFRFDLVNYRTRFSLPTDLDFVLLEIGGNDQAQVGGAAALTRISTLYPIFLSEIRRAWPDTQIIGWSGASAYTNDSDIRWTERRPIYAAEINAVRAAVTAGDTKMHFVSAWMHQTVRSGYPLNSGTVDALTGATRTTLADDVHQYWPARQQGLEVLSAAIANLV